MERSEKEMERSEKKTLQWQLAERERKVKHLQQEREKEKSEFLAVLEQKNAQLKWERKDRETFQQHYTEYHQLKVKELQGFPALDVFIYMYDQFRHNLARAVLLMGRFY